MATFAIDAIKQDWAENNSIDALYETYEYLSDVYDEKDPECWTCGETEKQDMLFVEDLNLFICKYCALTKSDAEI